MDERAAVVAIAAALDRWYALLGRQYGPLSRPPRRLLAAVAGQGGVRVGDLAARLGLTTAGATRMVDTLESLGYAQRVRLPDVDQRQVHVTLTPQGAAALEEADLAFQEAVEATLASLTPTERATLARLLATIGGVPAGVTPH